MPPNTASTGNNFAEILNGRSLSGRVFLDFNNDGALNQADHGIGQQTINLTGTDINGNAVSASTTTVSAGTYSSPVCRRGPVSGHRPAPGRHYRRHHHGWQHPAGHGGWRHTERDLRDQPGRRRHHFAENNFAKQPGAAADLTITKTHSPASFGEGSSTGYYTITSSNVGTLATSGTITVVDTMPSGITPTSASGTGWTCVIAGQVVTCTSSVVIAASGTGNVITLRVAVANGLSGQILINTAVISGGSEPPGFDGNNTASDPTPIATSATVSGHVWRDTNHNRIMDAGEVRLPVGQSICCTATPWSTIR